MEAGRRWHGNVVGRKGRCPMKHQRPEEIRSAARFLTSNFKLFLDLNCADGSDDDGSYGQPCPRGDVAQKVQQIGTSNLSCSKYPSNEALVERSVALP